MAGCNLAYIAAIRVIIHLAIYLKRLLYVVLMEKIAAGHKSGPPNGYQ